MKSFIALALLAFGLTANASCISSVSEAFSRSNPRHNLKLVRFDGTIKPGEDRPYLDGEIFNDTPETLSVYFVDSYFMIRYAYAYLVKESDCKIKRIFSFDVD